MTLTSRLAQGLNLKSLSRPTFVLAVLMVSSAIANDTATPAVALPTRPSIPEVRPEEVVAPVVAKVTTYTRIKSGLASWYGKEFRDRFTASGRRFNMYEMTAAHRDLPFGSRVRVTNLRNHRSVIVTITDRGELMPGRIIDLSYGAAKQLHMVESGVDPVTLEILSEKRVSGLSPGRLELASR